ncbi:hypothetical protein [Hydrogenimonas sp.]
MIDEGILNKESRLIALYGANAQTSPFLKVLNTTFKSLGLNDFAIGLNIKPEDLTYMVKGMPKSKVKMALYEPEYQEDAAALMDIKDTCVERSGLCDGALAADEKLHGVCFAPKAFETMLACEGVGIGGKKVLLLGAGALAKALLPLLGVMGAASIDIADSSVEAADAAIKSASSALLTIPTDILWFENGMEIDMASYDIIVNAIDIHAHSGKQIVKPKGENKKTVLIDFVRGESSFDTIAKETGCKKIGGHQWMCALALSVARDWLDTKVDCDDYDKICY